MLWELSVIEQRYRAVLEVLAGVPVTEVAGRYGVSRQSIHFWLRRYRNEGPPGLADRSHKVRAHPWQIPAHLESAVCELRRAHPKWGPKRLVFEMGRRGHGTVTRSTVYRVLVRSKLIEPKSRRRRRQDYKRWERTVNDQLDLGTGSSQQRLPADPKGYSALSRLMLYTGWTRHERIPPRLATRSFLRARSESDFR